MTVSSGRVCRIAVTVLLACLLAVAVVRGQEPAPQMTEDVFKSVVLLRGIPVDTFFDSMGMFAAAMGDDCTFCHASNAYFDRSAFAQPTPRLMRAREMIVMMNTINRTYFGGEARVTCFTCHSGNHRPVGEPNLALQYGTPTEDPNVLDIAVDTRLSSDQIFERYLRAVGGSEAAGRLTSFVGKGKYSGFDTAFAEVPVEVFAGSPNRRTTVVHMFNGASTRAFDGRGGWMAGPDTPVPLLTLTAANLDRVRLEALVSFPAGLKQAFSQWRAGRTAINEQEVQVVQGLVDGRPVANFYFDEAGLLVRLVRWTDTPVGRVPVEIDYTDYREVAGVRMPFRWTVSQTFMQMVIQLDEVQPNVPIDSGRFGKPAAFVR